MTTETPDAELVGHEGEPHDVDHKDRLNWLRAAVLGANDGIVSVAGLVVGVAAGAPADTRTEAVLVAGIAGLAAGALSMGAGEYVSVSTQRDTESALIDKERRELAEMPEEELEELAEIYESKGLSPALARQVAEELTAHDALGAHAEVELGIDPDNLVKPWSAAFASMGAFTVGALLPLVFILFSPASIAFYVTLAAVGLALAITGLVSARLGEAPVGPAVLRNVGGGMFAMVVTHLIGLAVGTQIG